MPKTCELRGWLPLVPIGDTVLNYGMDWRSDYSKQMETMDTQRNYVGIDIQRIDTERDLLGEGPVWDPQEQALYWVDIVGRRIRRFDPSTGNVVNWVRPRYDWLYGAS